MITKSKKLSHLIAMRNIFLRKDLATESTLRFQDTRSNIPAK